VPGDSQGFDRSHSPITLRSWANSTKENRHERLQEFGSEDMAINDEAKVRIIEELLNAATRDLHAMPICNFAESSLLKADGS